MTWTCTCSRDKDGNLVDANLGKFRFVVDPNDGKIVYATSDGPGNGFFDPGPDLFKSTDRGVHFLPFQTFTSPNGAPLPISAIANTAADSNTFWVGLSNGTVQRTSYALQPSFPPWVPFTIPGAPVQPVSALAIDPTKVDRVVVTYPGYNAGKHVFLTTHAGYDWTDITGNLPDRPANSVVFDPATSPPSIIVATDAGIYRSANLGASWETLGDGFPNAVATSLALDSSVKPSLLRVGTFGRSVFEFNAPPAPAQIVLTQTDAGTQGNWKGKYGQDGSIIANDVVNPPGYATVNFAGASRYTWAQSSAEGRVLLKTAVGGDRIASAYFADSFTIDLNLTDLLSHQVAIYCLVFDTNARAQKFTLIDANAQQVLETKSVSNFHNGLYLIWNLQGHVLIRVEKTAGANAVVSGIFFRTFNGSAPTVTITSPAPGPVSGTVSLDATAMSSTTLASMQFLLDGSNLFGPTTPIYSGGGIYGLTFQWPSASVANGSHTLLAVAFDIQGQQAVSLPVKVTVNNPAPVTSVSFVRMDTSTLGSWKGHYGGDGELIAKDSNNPPPYAVVQLNGATEYGWGVTQDPRALQQLLSTQRIASTFYTASSFTIDLNLFDGQSHQVALYFLDWDDFQRAETVTVRDANTLSVLDTRTLSGFRNGQYAVWNIRGHVILQFTKTGGPNAVVSGLFFAPPAP